MKHITDAATRFEVIGIIVFAIALVVCLFSAPPGAWGGP